MNDDSAPNTREQTLFRVLALAVVLRTFVAAVRAWTWSDVERGRNLIVVAPETAQVSIVDGPPLIDETHGVHTWSVTPGPIILEMRFSDQEHTAQRTKVIIPKGLGGLMLEVTQDNNGELVLGYF